MDKINVKNTNNKLLFDLYSVGKNIGYVTKSKGKYYPHKTRIDKIIRNSDIEVFIIDNDKYIDINGIKTFITFSHSEKTT